MKGLFLRSVCPTRQGSCEFIERSLEGRIHNLKLCALAMDGNNGAKEAPQPAFLLEALMTNITNPSEKMAHYCELKDSTKSKDAYEAVKICQSDFVLSTSLVWLPMRR